MGKKKGRPTKYRKEYCDDIIQYFDIPPQQVVYKQTYYANGTLKSEEPVTLPAQFPTMQGFARMIGVNIDTLHEWRKQYLDFSEAYTRAQELQEKIWLINGMGGLYNAQFAQFFGKNCLGYKDRQEVEHSGGMTVASIPEEDAVKALEALGYVRK